MNLLTTRYTVPMTTSRHITFGLVALLPLCLLISTFTEFSATAQERRIMSPAGRSATQVGGSPFDPVRGFVNDKWIEVRYGRPLTRGRNIFGLDDYREALNDGAEVWRAGANHTTQLITDVPLMLDDTRLEAGTYTLFIDLAASPWEFIVSSWPAQVTFDEDFSEALYGAYGYTDDRDVLRIPMDVETPPWTFDQLSWQFLDVTETGGRLAMFWDDTMASVTFSLVE
jgi:hypothetical protein